MPGRQLLRHPAPKKIRGLSADRRGRVERGIEGLADLVQVPERLAEHRQLGRNAHARFPGRPGHGDHGAAQLKIAEAALRELGDDLADATAEIGLVEILRLLFAQRERALRGFLARPSPIAISRRKRPSRMSGGNLSHHAEVEERDAPVLRQEDVAGVRIGVEEPVDHDLVQVGAEELVGQGAAVDVHAPSAGRAP